MGQLVNPHRICRSNPRSDPTISPPMVCRTLEIVKGKRKVVCFTHENGSPFVISVRSDAGGLGLADLATERELDSGTVPATFLPS